MAISWLTGFLDFPADVFEAGRDFWLEVTGYPLSAPADREVTSRPSFLRTGTPT
jgi:hypothetical protein